MRQQIIFVFAISFIFLLDSSDTRAQDKKEIYRRNLISHFTCGDNDESVDRYWVFIANRIRNGQALAELPTGTKKMAFDIIEPVQQANLNRHTFVANSLELADFEKQTRRIEAEAVDGLFALLGTDLLLQASEEYAQLQLASVVENDGFNGLMKIIERGLSMPTVVRLDEGQKDKIDQVTIQYKAKQAKLKRQYLGELRDLTQQLWPRLMKALSTQQAAEANRILGKQAEWFRFIGLPQRFLIKPDRTGFGHVAERVREKYGINLMDLVNVTDKEFVESGFEPVNPLIYDLVSSSFIADELDLTVSQRDELSELKKKHWLENVIVIYRQPDDRMELLLNKENFDLLPSGLTKILIGNQQRSILQIELQLRTGVKFSSTAGLTHPRVIKHLELNPFQVHDLERIGEEYARTCSPIFDEYKRLRETMQAEFVAAVLDCLKK